jgi:hypothetical protein
MFRRIVALVFVAAVAGIGVQAPWAAVSAQTPSPSADSQRLNQRIDELDARVDRLRVRTNAGGLIAFLFGAFCALWAQNTRRNPWGWFFLGLFFSVITVFVLLWKNADDLLEGRNAPAR